MPQQFVLQAITTKYLSPTDTKGARIKATASAGSITLSWEYSLNTTENHAVAAHALANKFGWLESAKLFQGCDHNGNCVFVVVEVSDILHNV